MDIKSLKLVSNKETFQNWINIANNFIKEYHLVVKKDAHMISK